MRRRWRSIDGQASAEQGSLGVDVLSSMLAGTTLEG